MMPFTTIYKFMWKDLGLHGAEKEFFAVIYGFWRRSKTPVEIPSRTVTEITGLSQTSVIMAKRALLKKEIVAAQEISGKPSRYEEFLREDPFRGRGWRGTGEMPELWYGLHTHPESDLLPL